MTSSACRSIAGSAFLLFTWATGAPVYAQSADLVVCNRGKVPVEVVVAKQGDMLIKYWWNVIGTEIAPGSCTRVYHDNGEHPAYIGFGFADSRGQWGSGVLTSVPDLGSYVPHNLGDALREGGRSLMTHADKTLCVRRDKTEYHVDGYALPELDCDSMKITGPDNVGHGPYVPLNAVLRFEPQNFFCWGSISNGTSQCAAGDYTIDIAPTGAQWYMKASSGSGKVADAQNSGGSSTSGPSWLEQLWQGYLQSLKDGTASPLPPNAKWRPPDVTPAPATPAPTTPAPTTALGPDPIRTGGFIVPPPPSTDPTNGGKTPVVRQLIFGGEVHLAADGWHDADGNRLSEWMVDAGSGLPPLRSARPQHATTDQPVFARLATIQYVLRDVSQCTEYLDSSKKIVMASISTTRLDLDEYGVIAATATASVGATSKMFNGRIAAALANLDFAAADIDDRGCIVLTVPCNYGGCARYTTSTSEDQGSSSLKLRLSTKGEATTILNALKELARFYPDGGTR